MRRAAGAVAGALLLAACGGPPGAPAPAPGTWVPLVASAWQLEAGADEHLCWVATLAHDVSADALRPASAAGLHHTVLTAYDGPLADGAHDCQDAGDDSRMLFGSGRGAEELIFPDGVGLELAAGTRVLLNAHLVNPGDAALAGVAGIEARLAAPGAIAQQAEHVLAGPTFGLSVPAGQSVQRGTCPVRVISAEQPIFVFALSQHMHAAGRRLRTVRIRDGEELVLQDVAYDHEVQRFARLAEVVELRPGDGLRTECTYDYGPGDPRWPDPSLAFGPTADDEMCFSNVFYWPAVGGPVVCSSVE